ncbi:MAG TPA: fibronectin type III domain-containing protein, partial [Tepidisphaeraceae bacterium]|nr:fibronectin type III domain-containing protein [Tepidisphaeraceae bacterium]
FFFLIADADRDRAVSLNDNTALEANLFQSNKKFHQGDFNLDGTVDLADWTILQANFGRQMPAPLSEANTMQAAALSSSATRLTWTAPSTGTPDGYRIFRSLDGSNFSLLEEVNNSTHSHDDPGLNDGTKYWYRVRPFTNAHGNGATTNKHSAVTVLPPPSITSITSISDSEVQLYWSDSSQSSAEYVIEARPVGTSAFNLVATVVRGLTSTTIDGLEGGVTYEFRMMSRNSFIPSSYTVNSTVTTPAGVPLAPSDLQATSLAPGQVQLNWTNNSRTATSILVQQLEPAVTGWETVATLGNTVTNYSLNSVEQGTAFRYRTITQNLVGTSLPTGYVELASSYGPPAPPTQLELTLGNRGIWLQWIDNSNNEFGFSVEERTELGTFQTIGHVPRNETEFFADASLAGTRRAFRVVAFNPHSDAVSEESQFAPKHWGLGGADGTFGDAGAVSLATSTAPGLSSLWRDAQGSQDVAVRPDGRIVTMGIGVLPGASGVQLLLTQHLPNGDLDETFGAGGHSSVGAISVPGGNYWRASIFLRVLENGKLLVGADHLYQFNANGSLDTSFGTSGVLSGESMGGQFATPM